MPNLSAESLLTSRSVRARPGADASDAALMRLVSGGDGLAFEQLYDRHATAAFTLARRLLGDQRAAEDACQEAFMAIWRNAASFDSARGAVRPWILGIARNRCIDAIRQRAVNARRLDTRQDVLDAEPAAERTEAQALGAIQAQELLVTLDVLPDEQRQVIALAYYGGLTHREIAELLHEPLGTVKGRLRLGLDKLHRRAHETVGA